MTRKPKTPSPAPVEKKAVVKKPSAAKQNGSRIDLAHRERLFSYEFHHNGGNATQAAIQAGYSPRSAQTQGSELLSSPMVITHLQNLSAQSARDSIADAIEVHEALTDILRGKVDHIYPTKSGLLTGPPPTGDRIKAASELQKMRGGYAPVKVEHQVQNHVQIWMLQSLQVIQQRLKLSQQELDALASALPALTLDQVK
ncbi:terminase small subunit [Deinococcus marmoris]|uniref:Terminase small subunit n=1 Tax=Deinococcus marmoris TaxID=249408 RepID=A0A1U7P2Z0_9DEIO|nr:terminase small subunit [Deinococcus marmoris]OLV19543.1 hypothetical protein BOO71_0002368 [Deinococcus marmoris]